MRPIKQSTNKEHWPKKKTQQVECRKRDLVIRISNWLEDEYEPAYDVELYIGGVYDFNESEVFALSSGLTREAAKIKAIEYSKKQIEKLL